MATYTYETLYEIIERQAEKRGSKKAIFVNDEVYTYVRLKKLADAMAGYLTKRGVKKGDKVALFMRNGAEFVVAAFAVAKLGAIIVPINTFLKSEELRYILEDSDAEVLLASDVHRGVIEGAHIESLCRAVVWEGALKSDEFSFAEAFASDETVPKADITEESVAVMFYTSGTTGRPKGAMLSHKNILSNIEAGRIAVKVTHNDRSVVFLPMFHSFTFSIATMLPLAVGGSLVVIPSLRPFSNIFKQVLLKRVTIFLGVPDVYNALSKAKLPWYFMWFNRIRVFISGAAPLQGKTLEAMSNKFKRAVLLEGYGLSEASPAVCINRLDKQKAGSVGPALPGYEVKVVDEAMNEVPRGEVGDIITYGDHVMQGYYKRPEATSESIVNGWLITGDMGYMDEEGFLYIVDRKKDLIISKGINIYPREIEEIIDRFEGIAASAVIGIPDEKSGEIPVAYIELEEDCKGIDELELKRYLRKHLANYKIPKHYRIIDALPKNATGKVLKRVLKERLRQEKG
jgi:long-chain acyl-CoA synthetase